MGEVENVTFAVALLGAPGIAGITTFGVTPLIAGSSTVVGADEDTLVVLVCVCCAD
jgi:hypothetical protein